MPGKPCSSVLVIFTSLINKLRDENAKEGMMTSALQVLRSVHAGVFAARAAPPVRGPDGRLIRREWDVRHVLHKCRMEVQRHSETILPKCTHTPHRPVTMCIIPLANLGVILTPSCNRSMLRLWSR